MAVAYKQTTQQVLIAPRRFRRVFPFGPTGRWIACAVVAFALYRSIPTDPGAELRTAVQQHLQFDYTNRRAPEMRAGADPRTSDALLAVADDVLNARVDVDAITVRGPLLPPPLPRTAVVHVHYRIMKGGKTLETQDRYLAFGKSLTMGWQFAGERSALAYWTLPV